MIMPFIVIVPGIAAIALMQDGRWVLVAARKATGSITIRR